MCHTPSTNPNFLISPLAVQRPCYLEHWHIKHESQIIKYGCSSSGYWAGAGQLTSHGAPRDTKPAITKPDCTYVAEQTQIPFPANHTSSSQVSVFIDTLLCSYPLKTADFAMHLQSLDDFQTLAVLWESGSAVPGRGPHYPPLTGLNR